MSKAKSKDQVAPKDSDVESKERAELAENGGSQVATAEGAGEDSTDAPEGSDKADENKADEKEPLHLSIEITSPSACQRHVTVTVPRDDIDRYYGTAVDELMPTAQVPGFRAGRAPRKLVESKFRKELSPQVKGQVVMDAITQVTETEKLSPISEPDFDFESVDLPDVGPLVFEYSIEVRPEFELPKWKGLKLERPVKKFSKADIDGRLERLLTGHGKLVPKDGPAESGDYVAVNLTFRHGNRKLNSAEEEVIRIRPVLSFRDGRIEEFEKVMVGVKAGETRVGQAKISADALDKTLRGQTVDAEFEVLEVKKAELPELTPSLLERLGGFQNEGELRDAIQQELEGQLRYHQSQKTRQQVTAALVEAANWELPPDLLRRQSQRELERTILELQASGFSTSEVRAHANELRQNILAVTARKLKEHFILERIAEEEKIEESDADYDAEIRRIALQSGESPRRVRARLEKRDMMDVLRNQIIERKVLDLIYEHAQFKEVAFEQAEPETEAIDQAASSENEQDAIPEARHDEGEPESAAATTPQNRD
jgi:trigger factor